MNRALAALLALCALAMPLVGRTQIVGTQIPSMPDSGSVELDRGSFQIYQADQLLGTEVFSFVGNGDSLLVTSRTFQVLPSGDTLRKDVAQVVGLYDYGLRSYRSKQRLAGHLLSRGLHLGDTTVTSARQFDERGEVDELVLPPGRVFVVDPKMFVSFDLICRSLNGKTFERRPIVLFVMGPRDTMIEAMATDLGSETIRWGARPIQARKLEIGDERTKFIAWAAPGGKLLRLSETTSGLRVERQPAAVRSRASRPKPGG